MGRLKIYGHDQNNETVINQISMAIEAPFASLIYRDLLQYEGDDMTKGEHPLALAEHADLFMPIMKMDPRGGHIGQKDGEKVIDIKAVPNHEQRISNTISNVCQNTTNV